MKASQLRNEIGYEIERKISNNNVSVITESYNVIGKNEIAVNVSGDLIFIYVIKLPFNCFFVKVKAFINYKMDWFIVHVKKDNTKKIIIY
jgi:hypothetical protein